MRECDIRPDPARVSHSSLCKDLPSFPYPASMSPTVRSTQTIHSISVGILEDIFLTCVQWYRTRISPLVLAAVCRHWREVALASGRLWTDIDVLRPHRAELFVQRSQNADLDVVLCEGTIRERGQRRSSMADGMPWLYSQVDRFRILVVHTGPTKPTDIVPIVSLPDRAFPRLKAVVLTHVDERGDSWFTDLRPFSFEVKLPALRHLTLWCVFQCHL